MISEYVENLRARLNAAVKAENSTDVRRLADLMNKVMIDGALSGETMPWEKQCPLCGTPFPSQSEGGK